MNSKVFFFLKTLKALCLLQKEGDKKKQKNKKFYPPAFLLYFIQLFDKLISKNLF